MSAPVRLVLYQPDIPQNAGNMLRTAACFEVPVDVVEPCGFVFSDRRLRRAGMDYLKRVRVERYSSWPSFLGRRLAAGAERERLVLLTAAGDVPYHEFRYRAGDLLLVGRESEGVPAAVAAEADARVRIPMAPHARSLNVAVAAAIVLGEALRQLAAFPRPA
jgi:tRNA (cytidine/uridine-2'-O-)-methyltransferase